MAALDRLTVILMAVFLIASLEGCGRKLPPIQPGTYPPPAVKDLTFEVKDDRITLSWTTPAVQKEKESPAVGFKILRARQTLSEAECQTCSAQFLVIGDVRVTGKEPGERLQFQDRLESGYKYRYKVRGYTTPEAQGKDSNVVIPNP
jgi:hypothetical protein